MSNSVWFVLKATAPENAKRIGAAQAIARGGGASLAGMGTCREHSALEIDKKFRTGHGTEFDQPFRNSPEGH